MTITTKADERIMNAFARINGEYKTIDLWEADDVCDMYRCLLDAMGDDDVVVYCHPVYVVHDSGYLDRLLQTYDYVGIQQRGQSYMDMSIFAATRTGLKTIIAAYQTGMMAIDDHNSNPDHNMHNLVLNSLGQRARVIIDDGTLIKHLDVDMRGSGIIATHCGSNGIIKMTQRCKLDLNDIVVRTMEDKWKGGQNGEA